MRIFVCDVSEYFARGMDGSQAVRALLRHAVQLCWNMPCPRLEKRPDGKPFFPEHPDKFLSLSHSKSHVLVALSDKDVGADVESLREIKGDPERLFSKEMLDSFGYFGGWTLRESVFKLCGKGSLRSMDFGKVGGEILPPFEGLRCRLYDALPGCVAAAACYEGDFPVRVEIVDASIIFT